MKRHLTRGIVFVAALAIAVAALIVAWGDAPVSIGVVSWGGECLAMYSLGALSLLALARRLRRIA